MSSGPLHRVDSAHTRLRPQQSCLLSETCLQDRKEKKRKEEERIQLQQKKINRDKTRVVLLQSPRLLSLTLSPIYLLSAKIDASQAGGTSARLFPQQLYAWT